MKKHIIAFTLNSQGNISQEVYFIGMDEDAEMTARKLLKWFNKTGGNKDGSFRTFNKIVYDKIIDADEYEKDKIKFLYCDDYYEWHNINYYGVNLSKTTLTGGVGINNRKQRQD